MTDVSLVSYERKGVAAVLTLNRPDRRNALNRSLIEAIGAGFRRAASDEGARCVILTGAGASFCAGMDLEELQATMAAPASDQESVVWDDALRLSRLYDFIYTLAKPTIAAVNGAAVAGGAGLVTVCDLAVAAAGARLGYPEVRRGLVAAMVMPHLLRHVGERLARYLLISGELIDAARAFQAGLVNEVVAAEDLLPTALKWASQIAEGGPQAIARTKQLLWQFSRQAVSVEDAAKESAAPRLSEECRGGLQAFFAKQPAPWAPRP